jgi:hypothetical protein
MLPKKGNSNSDERLRFLEEMLKIFPAAEIRCLCADREFVGQAWLRYLLLEPDLPFRIRIRATDKIKRGGKTKACQSRFRSSSERRIATTQRGLPSLG